MRVWQTLSSNAQGSSSSRSVRPRRLLSAFMVIPSVRKRARCFIRSSASSTSLGLPRAGEREHKRPLKEPGVPAGGEHHLAARERDRLRPAPHGEEVRRPGGEHVARAAAQKDELFRPVLPERRADAAGIFLQIPRRPPEGAVLRKDFLFDCKHHFRSISSKLLRVSAISAGSSRPSACAANSTPPHSGGSAGGVRTAPISPSSRPNGARIRAPAR